MDAKDSAMRIIEPPSADDDRAIAILKLLDEKLRKLQKRLKAKGARDSSTRPIQGNRYEIFVQSRSKLSTFFDELAAEIENESETKDLKLEPGEIKRTLIGFAKKQASSDSRVGDGFEFDNFSLLVSYGVVDAQIRHIDLLYPNMQFGLILTDKSPGTISYTSDYHVHNEKDLQQAWPDMPKGLVDAINQKQQARDLLSGFGDVLCPKLEPNKIRKLLRTGTVVSLPGSVVHAGPKCNKYRTVMFWSGSPKGAAVAQYNPDTQYFASMLCCDLANILWSSLNEDDRFYLLWQMAEHIKNERIEGHRTLHKHFDNPEVVKFARNVSEGQYPKGKRDEYIREFARTAELTGLPVEVYGNEGEDWVVESVDGLVVEYDGHMDPAQILRRPDDNVVIKYLTSDGGTEGNGVGEKYTLTYHEPSGDRERLFDGSNGTLRDNDGEQIKCAWMNKRLCTRE